MIHSRLANVSCSVKTNKKIHQNPNKPLGSLFLLQPLQYKGLGELLSEGGEKGFWLAIYSACFAANEITCYP